MPSDQTLIFGIFGRAVRTLLVWGRIRYDLVAFGALILAALLGLVPKKKTFSPASAIPPSPSSPLC